MPVDDRLSDFMDYTMFNNTIGQETYLFTGRHDDGTERYIRWGKQFREFPELIHDENGFSIPKPFLKKLGSKGSPQLQIGSQLFTGKSLSGFENWDMRDKKGWDWTVGALEMIAKSSVPFALSSTLREDKRFRPTDLMMPSGKGMTQSEAIDLYKRAIDIKDGEINVSKIRPVYIGAVQNGLPAFDLLKTAIASAKADQTTKIKRDLRDLEEVNKRIQEEEAKKDYDPLLLEGLYKKKQQLLKDKQLFEYSMDVYPKLEEYLEAREKEFIKDLDEKASD